MGKFFNELAEAKLIEKWADTLDWIFDDDKFDKNIGWEKGQVGKFTKRVKKLPKISEEHFSYKRAKEMVFPDSNSKFSYPVFYMVAENSEGRALVRHIRNGIAHGKASIYRVAGELYIRICDYGKEGIQTAFIAIPLLYITNIYEIYHTQESAMKTDKNLRKKNAGKIKNKIA